MDEEMNKVARHEMQLEATFASGAEEWSCSACGRRLVLQWSPKYRRIVLEHGDMAVTHTGGYAGLRIDSTQPSPGSTAQDADDSLDAWQEGLADIDLG